MSGEQFAPYDPPYMKFWRERIAREEAEKKQGKHASTKQVGTKQAGTKRGKKAKRRTQR